VKLDSAFGSSELSPWKQGKTQIDGRGVQSVCGLNKIDSNAVARVQNLSALDQDLSEVPKDSPIPAFVGIGKGALGDISSDSDTIKPALHHAQARNDIPQAFAVSQLSEYHDHELGIAPDGSRPPVSAIPLDTLFELVSRQEIQQLGKNELPLVHVSTPRPLSGVGNSGAVIFPFQIEKSFLPRRRANNQYSQDFRKISPDSSEGSSCS